MTETSPLATAHGPAGDRPLQAQRRQDARGQLPDVRAAHRRGGRRKADLVVLGETLTYVGLGKKYHEVAEPIPGPSTEYFGRLAKKHNLYIVPGLLERDGHLVYNVAVLIGPDGKIIGKYRKVCLPRGEIEGGITPGSDYPVFPTRFGKVGLMVCYDGFFPEVARELSNRGRRGDRLAGLGLQPAAGPRPRLREPRLPGQQHLRGHLAELDDLGGLRSHRRADRAGQGVGHRGGRRGGPESPHPLGQPRRFQGGDPPPSPFGRPAEEAIGHPGPSR